MRFDDWGRQLAVELLASIARAIRPGLRSRAMAAGISRNEPQSDGRRDLFLSSLPGGEQMTGTLRSPSFQLPARLSFYICGHRGFPKNEASDKNLVRLRLLDDDRVVQTAFPTSKRHGGPH